MKKTIPADAVLVPDEAKRVFQGMIFDVYQWPQKLFNGSEHTFEMLKRTDTANAICVVDDKLLVLHDEQPHLGSRQGFPGGRIDPEDLSPLTAAQREIREETGYSFQNWRLVKVWQPYRKMEWFIHVWLAWEVLNKIEPHVDAGEKIQVESLELAEVKQKVLQRVGYLGDYESIFKNIEKIDQLLALPQFSGREVDR